MNIAQAKALVSVEEVIGTRIELHRRGAVLVGPCPFHDDRGRPNLVVFPNMQTWQCFAGGAQGTLSISSLTSSRRVQVAGDERQHLQRKDCGEQDHRRRRAWRDLRPDPGREQQ